MAEMKNRETRLAEAFPTCSPDGSVRAFPSNRRLLMASHAMLEVAQHQ